MLYFLCLFVLLRASFAQDEVHSPRPESTAEVFPNDLIALDGGMRVVKADHGNFLVSDNDLFISKSLRIFGSYDGESLNVLLQAIQPGDVVFDIGANIGAFTVAFAKEVGLTGRVHAFEPLVGNYYRLIANIALNNLNNVVTHNIAVDEVDEEGRFKLPRLNFNSDANFGAISLPSSTTRVEEMLAEGTYVEEMTDSIPARKLDSLFGDSSKCPSLMKIDVELMEIFVLRGGARLIERCSPIIHAENNAEHTSAELLDFLHGAGYECYWDVQVLPNPNNQKAPYDKPNHSINVLCVPRGARGDFTVIGFPKIDPAKPLLSDYVDQVQGRFKKMRQASVDEATSTFTFE